jgi:hypothetical protein
MESEKRLRLFVNPFAIWTELAFKTGEAMLASAHVAALRANAPRLASVAVIPTVDAPPVNDTRDAPPRIEAPRAVTRVRHASKTRRFKAARTKIRKADTKRRARPRAAR